MVYGAMVVFHGFYPFSPLDRNLFNLLVLPVIYILQLIGITDNLAEFGRGAGSWCQHGSTTWSTLAKQKVGKERALAPFKNKGEDTNPDQSSVQPLLCRLMEARG